MLDIIFVIYWDLGIHLASIQLTLCLRGGFLLLPFGMTSHFSFAIGFQSQHPKHVESEGWLDNRTKTFHPQNDLSVIWLVNVLKIRFRST